MGAAWSERDDWLLVDNWHDTPAHVLARRLGRSRVAVKNRASALGLVKDSRRWAAADAEIVGRDYATRPHADIAAELGRPVDQVRAMGHRLGLHKCRRHFHWTAAADAVLKTLHAQGWSDTEIGGKLGVERHRVSRRRDELGLAAWYGARGRPGHERLRRRVRRKTLEQCRAAGVRNLGELRGECLREFAIECGWPAEWELRAREAQILNYLAREGPSTLWRVAEGIGASTHRRNTVTGSPSLLTGTGYGQTYMGRLRSLGLVVYFHRGGGSRRQPGLYMLSEAAARVVDQRR